MSRTPTIRRRAGIALAVLAVGTTLAVGAVANATQPGADGPIVGGTGNPDAIPGQYLVTFKDHAVQQRAVGTTATDLANKYAGKVKYVYRHALRGFSVNLGEHQARKLAAEPSVALVEQDSVARIADTQPTPPSWGVDRIDQRDLPLSNSYTYPANAGQGTTVYVLDTGIRKSHQDFGTRASFGPDYVDNDNDSTDCNGHGSHVAGSAAGTTYGVAKKANIVALRVLNCSGSGDFSGIVSAVDWVRANAQKPAVANMSLGGSGSNQTLETAVTNAIASGVPFALAAGNSDSDACNFTPARTPNAITVGNSTKTDARNNNPAGPSNYGPCLDIWAPGTDIVSAWYDSDTATRTISGTSMASPHVAGVAALYLAANANATPAQVRAALVDNATKDKLTDIKAGSPNLLLYMGFLNGGGPSPVTVANPGTQTGTVGRPASLTNSASGGTAPYTWTATGLPAGLSIGSSSGTISGTPTTQGTSNVTVTARDSASPAQSGSASFGWTINPDGGGDAITNGGFESGSLSGWTPGGTGNSATVVNSGAHGGTYAARLGTTTATNGDSTVSQTFTAPANAGQLSFWYSLTCPDTVFYAWAKATLRDNTSGTTTTPLAKTCTNGQGWRQVTAPVTGGHSYTLTLVNRDDNYPDDPVYTLYDDVSLDVQAGNDFSIAANPQTLTVQPGQSGTSTISTTVTGGSAQQVALSTSGLPGGATASFNPATVTAGQASTLTISTTAQTPNGTTTVTVLGDGSDVDRTTTLSLTVGPPAGGLQRISTDTYTNTNSQHATQVESDSFAYGNTIVAAFQTGRFNNGGASNIAWSTSTDGGTTWRTGNLRGLTVHDGGPNDRSTDPVVAYSAKHGTWLIGTTPLDESGGSARGLGMQVLRSPDGTSWGNPITAVAMNDSKNYDKNALGCDNTPSSPFYGNCYATIDIFSESNQLVIAVSQDGGQSWGPVKTPAGVTGTLPNGVATLPNGVVVVVYDRVSGGNNQMVTRSTDGGNTWSAPINVSDIQWHTMGGGLRGNPMPDIDVDGSGKLYVSWADSRFRSGAANDVVYSTSTDGQTWTAPVRVPIDATGSGTDHYFPELVVDGAKIGVFYYDQSATCSSQTSCQLKVGFVSSTNGGSSWSAPQTLAGPFALNLLAQTSQGPMIGDYSGGSMVAGKAVGVFSVGRAPTDGKAYDQAMYTYGPQAITGGLTAAGRDLAASKPARQSAQRVRME